MTHTKIDLTYSGKYNHKAGDDGIGSIWYKVIRSLPYIVSPKAKWVHIVRAADFRNYSDSRRFETSPYVVQHAEVHQQPHGVETRDCADRVAERFAVSEQMSCLYAIVRSKRRTSSSLRLRER